MIGDFSQLSSKNRELVGSLVSESRLGSTSSPQAAFAEKLFHILIFIFNVKLLK